MSISTMYLASGSTPENDTRMVGNILLRQGDKEHRQERTRPEEPTYDQAGRAPGPPPVAGTKLSPATESESARRSRVGDAESWELERPGASGHRPREPLPRAGERPRPWLPAGPEPAQLRSVLPRVGSFRISFFRQVLLLVLMRASKSRRIKRKLPASLEPQPHALHPGLEFPYLPDADPVPPSALSDCSRQGSLVPVPFSSRPGRGFPRPESEKANARMSLRAARAARSQSQRWKDALPGRSFLSPLRTSRLLETQGAMPISPLLIRHARYLPDLVMIISVPSSWNLSQSSLVSRLQAILAISSLGMMGVVGMSGSVHSEEEDGLLPPPLPPNSA